ncbi:Imm51 family immunity protein [Microbacterium sp. 179-I 3D3 NHS]|uniref:Imm51 family immunity protein n=1 Tax=Microbacterium sp. 179-I 3D3 NHS TaxID=3142382 RepID=UPI00399F8F51
MEPLLFVEHAQSCSLILVVGSAPAADAILNDAGWEPNGYTWERVVRRVVRRDLPDLAPSIAFDPEADMFVAHGPDGSALRALGTHLAALIADRGRIAQIVAEMGAPD